MNNIQKTVAIAAATVVAVGAYASFAKNVTLDHLAHQYPDIDRKIAKEAYRSIISKVLRGKLDTTNYTTDQFDGLFLQEVAKLTEK